MNVFLLTLLVNHVLQPCDRHYILADDEHAPAVALDARVARCRHIVFEGGLRIP